MYWHYVRHNLRPSVFFKMDYGERVVLRAFMKQEIEDEKKLTEKLQTQ